METSRVVSPLRKMDPTKKEATMKVQAISTQIILANEFFPLIYKFSQIILSGSFA
jgi:hypothetical protein